MSTSSNHTRRTPAGCQHCRIRHLKCDEQRPSCKRCEKAGIECLRSFKIRFRHSANPSGANVRGSGSAKTEFDFSRSQTWVKTHRNLTFLDETRDLMSFYDHELPEDDVHDDAAPWAETIDPIPRSTPRTNDHESEVSSGAQANLQRVHTTRYIAADGLSSPAKRRRLTFTGSYQASPCSATPADVRDSPAHSWHPSGHTGWTPTSADTLADALIYAASFTDLEPTSSQSNQVGFNTLPETRSEPVSSHDNRLGFDAISDSLSRIYLEAPVWPLSDREEAKLLRNYVANLARNFDLCDPYRHFRTVVPQRAATCPTLLNAIFALSARHLSRTSDYDPLVSNKYHQKCLKHLIPMLDDSAALLDENLLASTIILRHLEEIEVPLTAQSPSDQQSHLLGAHAFITAQERATMSGGLRQAAFWVGLRQEIYVAFCNQRTIMPALEHCNIDRSFEAAADHVWACRMVVLCADVIRYCFGEDDQLTSTYQWLADSVGQWYDCKPGSFTPIYIEQPSDGNVFADIWFLGDDVIVGWQHYHIAKILLSAHNPKIPRIGPSRGAALRMMDDKIKEHVKILCGICMSNPEVPPNFTYASMAITLAGDKFVERYEQEALLNVLNLCDKRYALPTGHAQEDLKAAWGWAQSV